MIVLVYMSVNDMEKNKEIMKCIEKHMLLLLLFASIGALFSPGFLGLKSLTP